MSKCNRASGDGAGLSAALAEGQVRHIRLASLTGAMKMGTGATGGRTGSVSAFHPPKFSH